MKEDKRLITDYLQDIEESIQKAQRFLRGATYETFMQNDEKQYAVIRALEIIGEATKKIPDTIRLKYPEIPWRAISGMRDKLIH